MIVHYSINLSNITKEEIDLMGNFVKFRTEDEFLASAIVCTRCGFGIGIMSDWVFHNAGYNVNICRGCMRDMK